MIAEMMRKQITFDLSQEALEAHYPRGERAQSEYHYRKAYQDIRRFMEKQGFMWRQNSVYVSEAPMTTMDIVLLSQRMAEKLPWLRLCVKEITATDIGAQYSLLGLLRGHVPPAELLPSVPEKRPVPAIKHSQGKLIRQIWSMGIRDKHLIWNIKRILKAPIKLPDGTIQWPDKGTPQGGIISPLLANIVLNELDHWIESQWQRNPVIHKYSTKVNHSGSVDYGKGYRAMKTTHLKEMFIVRYADDFRIFCRTKGDAERAKIAITQWLSDRLKLEVSEAKTRIVNVKRRYSQFLGFKIRVHRKGQKQVVKSHMCDKALRNQNQKLTDQAKRIARPAKGRKEYDEIRLFNSMVMGVQNYYCIATHINLDCDKLQYAVSRILHNRLRTQKENRLRKTGRPLTQTERERYGKSKQIRYVAGSQEPIYPIGYVQHKNPIAKRRNVCCYTPEGRQGLHDNLRINTSLMLALMQQPLYDRNTEYADNRISLFSAQWGKCAVTGKDFMCIGDIYCHHKIPKCKGGTDKYSNLVLILEPIHKLIHATGKDIIAKYLEALRLKKNQLAKVNAYRQLAGLKSIA